MSERTVPALERLRKARQQLHELTGYEAVSISGLIPSEAGWELAVDVVELRRVPDTATVLATYRVKTDEAGDVAAFELLRRYTRGRTFVADEASTE